MSEFCAFQDATVAVPIPLLTAKEGAAPGDLSAGPSRVRLLSEEARARSV